MNAILPFSAAGLRSFSSVLVFLFAVAATRAADEGPGAPPHYPDATHVFNGCHLSSLAYLVRFVTEFPSEHGRPIVVRLRNGDGQVRSHTMALVTWRGAWWIRDEYFGVFPLECTPANTSDPARLTARAERLYVLHAGSALREGTARPPEPPARFPAALRARDATAAAAALPVLHTIFWVKDGAREIPLVFFRPTPGVIAVYDPVHGTGLTECAGGNDAKITALIAARFGYRVEDIRADTTSDTAFAASVASLFSIR